VEQEKFESWAIIEGYEGLYEINRLGQIRRIGRAAINGKGRGGGARIGRLIKALPTKKGYLAVQLWKDGKMRRFQLHVLVARAFLGQAPTGTEVNHRDGDKHNPAANNLEYLSHSENMKHAYRNGLYPSGANHHWARLTAAQVNEIRQIQSSGKMGCRKLARLYGISKSAVQLIVRRENWAHV